MDWSIQYTKLKNDNMAIVVFVFQSIVSVECKRVPTESHVSDTGGIANESHFGPI